MIFKSFWSKLYRRWIEDTPGIGYEDDALRAVQNSREALAEAERVSCKISPDAEFIKAVVTANHFAARVQSVWGIKGGTAHD